MAFAGMMSLVAQDPAIQPFIDDTQPGWRALGAEDFADVNSASDTWSWKEGVLHCTGQPLSVLRTTQTYENFEMVVEWSHQKPAGNSGVFVWVTPESIQRLTQAGKPGLPDGIEVQILDHAYTDRVKASGGKTDWFGTNGDVFPVRVKMTPFPPGFPQRPAKLSAQAFGQRAWRMEPLLHSGHQWRSASLG